VGAPSQFRILILEEKGATFSGVYLGDFGKILNCRFWQEFFTRTALFIYKANQNVVDRVDAGPSETTIEATASWRFINGLYLQPDVQYVLNPNGLHGVQNPGVGYLRLQLNL
jgi:hypothetical protein